MSNDVILEVDDGVDLILETNSTGNASQDAQAAAAQAAQSAQAAAGSATNSSNSAGASAASAAASAASAQQAAGSASSAGNFKYAGVAESAVSAALPGSDWASVRRWTGGQGSLVLPPFSQVGYAVVIEHRGTGALTLTLPSGVNVLNSPSGVANQTSMVLFPGETCEVTADASTTYNVSRWSRMTSSARPSGNVSYAPVSIPPASQIFAMQSKSGLETGSVLGDYSDFVALNSWLDATAGWMNGLLATKTGTQRLYHLIAQQTDAHWQPGRPLAYADTEKFSGPVYALNAPNMLLNGSAALGKVGWSNAAFLSAQSDPHSLSGTYFYNAAALAASASGVSDAWAVGAGVTLSFQAELLAKGVTAGSAYACLVFLNSSGAVISTSPNLTVTNGADWTAVSGTYTTPANTASIQVQLGVSGSTVTVSSSGFAARRMKVEKSAAPSIYSPESESSLQGRILIAAQGPQNASANVFANLVDFDEYELEFEGLLPVLNGQNFGLHFSTDNGATWLIAAQYRGSVMYTKNTGNTVSAGGFTGVTSINMWSAMSNVSGSPTFATYEGTIKFRNFRRPAVCPAYDFTVNGVDSSDNGYGHCRGNGQYLGLTGLNINAFRVFCGSQGFSRGSFKLYGIR